MRRVALACAILSVLPSGSDTADLAEIKGRGTLRILVSADEVPELFVLTASPGPDPGLEREILEAFARGKGLSLDVVPVRRWDAILPGLIRGEGDLITGIVDTAARRERVAFTSEILYTRHLVISLKPQPPIRTLDALRKTRVAVIPRTSWADAAAEAGVPTSRMEACIDTAGLIEALGAKRAGSAVMSTIEYALASRRHPEMQAGMFLGGTVRVAWALRKTDVELKRALDEHIEAMRRSPSWARLVVKYLGEEALRMSRGSPKAP